MKLSTLLQTLPAWERLSGDDDDVLLACAIRLNRNLPDVRFPGWSTKNSRQQVIDTLKPVLLTLPCMKRSAWVDMAELSLLDRQLMVDRHLISQELAARQSGCAALISAKQDISILLNEEDHLVILGRQPGSKLSSLYKHISASDKHIEKAVTYAYDAKLGYLTADPTRLGSGMRASITLHLPALTLTGEYPKIKKALSEMDLDIQSIWGESTTPAGNLYEVSAPSDLDESSSNIIKHLTKVCADIALREVAARKTIITSHIKQFLDRVGRSIGILQNAQLISYREALDHLSWIRVGTCIGIIEWEEEDKMLQHLHILSYLCSKGHILTTAPVPLQNEESIPFLRAALLRQAFGEYSFSTERIESILL